MVVDYDGPECQGACPGRGCLEVMASGTAIGREARAAGRPHPDSALGRRLAAGAEITGAIATELAHEGDAAARAALAEVGRRLGAGLVSLVNALNPEVIVIGGGAVAAGDLLLEPARAGGGRARASAGAGGTSRSCPPTSAPSRACSARRCSRSDGERGVSGPARGLPHSDRQPGGRDPAGAGGPARGRRGRLRGHPPHARAAGPLRGQGAARVLPRAQRGGARRGAGRAHARRRHRRARVRRRACRSCRTRATCWCAAAWRPGCRWRCCRGRRRRSRRWWPRALPAAEWRFRGFLPRKRGELRDVLGEPGGTLVAFESPRRVPATLAVLADLDPDREVAVCRELTKAHEEVVRGTAGELAERYDGAPPRGEVVLVLAPTAARTRVPTAAALDALRRLVEAGAKPRRGGGGGGRADRRERERALPGAHLRRLRAPAHSHRTRSVRDSLRYERATRGCTIAHGPAKPRRLDGPIADLWSPP